MSDKSEKGYSDAFCKVYNEFGWNYFPQAFGEELIRWIDENHITVKTSMDLACGTGILCEVLYENGICSAGMDFSQGMIDIAQKSNPSIKYEVADMITFCPDQKYDLVTCTGDALNHIVDIQNVEKIFQNVYQYLSPGGYFIFDILNEKEVSTDEPFDLDFSDTVRAQFRITRHADSIIHLCTTVYENGKLQFQETITETIHDIDVICEMIRRTGFTLCKCGHQLSDTSSSQATTWYVIAQKN